MARPALRRLSAPALAFVLACAGQFARCGEDTAPLLHRAIETRWSAESGTGGDKARAVYLDTIGPCAYAALVRARGDIENFSVCGGTLRKRDVSPPPWPDNPATREFRARVIYLALLYRTSSGIDPNGYKIRAWLTDASADACKIAEVATIADNALVRLDRLPACPH